METSSFQKMIVHGDDPWVERYCTSTASGDTQIIPNMAMARPLVL